MNEPDDRLVGDFVWELFPTQAPRRLLTIGLWFLAGEMWFLSPPLSVILACLAASYKDLQAGWRLRRTIPDKAGGDICSLFTYAWGFWKLGVAAFAMMAFTLMVAFYEGVEMVPPIAFLVSMALWFAGFTASAIMTAFGLFKTSWSGMKVWVGRGINQARTLLCAMLIVGFFYSVLAPIGFWLASGGAYAGRRVGSAPLFLILMGEFGLMIGAPFVLLSALDRMSKRVVADTPGKLGVKMPAVGKWNGRERFD
jgi:hypothetical protein